MSHPMKIILELTGARRGQTVVLGKYQFVNGRTVLRGDSTKIGGAITYLGRIYSAFPLGSPELQKEQGNGKADADATAKQDEAVQVPGNVHNDGAAGAEAAASGDGTTGAGQPAAEHGAAGYRHPDTRLLEAVMALDHGNPEHWTEGGEPSLSAVATFFGSGNVTRKDVKRVAPSYRRNGG